LTLRAKGVVKKPRKCPAGQKRRMGVFLMRAAKSAYNGELRGSAIVFRASGTDIALPKGWLPGIGFYFFGGEDFKGQSFRDSFFTLPSSAGVPQGFDNLPRKILRG